MVWVRALDLRDVRNIREAGLELDPGLNVFLGRNAQGKTSLLEAVGLLARGRSFRTEDTPALIRRGASGLRARATAVHETRDTALEVEMDATGRRLRVDGHEVTAAHYHGRLEVVVYATDRLRVVRGAMRERRLYLDRGASALWPTYRRAARDYERVLGQRNAALAAGRRDLPAWNERFADLGARLRQRRAAYVARLDEKLRRGFRPAGESYGIGLLPDPGTASEETLRRALLREIEERGAEETREGRSLVGPHRDSVRLTVDGEDAALQASSGQARCLLLALALATLELYREETGRAAVALLDDLDSELDEERAATLCATVAGQGQALVTTTHAPWAAAVGELGRVFRVSAGGVTAT